MGNYIAAFLVVLSVGCYSSDEWACGCTPESIAAAEASPGLEVCEDGLDNDGDGLTDCEDPVCCAVCCYGEPAR